MRRVSVRRERRRGTVEVDVTTGLVEARGKARPGDVSPLHNGKPPSWNRRELAMVSLEVHTRP